jgi:hypothetical protein
MKTVHLSEAELTMLRNAMYTYLRSFGHNEADVVEEVKRVIAKLAKATEDEEPAELIG